MGRIVEGYGDHNPIADLPLWVGTESIGEPKTKTDVNWRFVITGLPTGLVNVVNSHLSFQVRISSPVATIDLGDIQYPLIHPPSQR